MIGQGIQRAKSSDEKRSPFYFSTLNFCDTAIRDRNALIFANVYNDRSENCLKEISLTYCIGMLGKSIIFYSIKTLDRLHRFCLLFSLFFSVHLAKRVLQLERANSSLRSECKKVEDEKEKLASEVFLVFDNHFVLFFMRQLYDIIPGARKLFSLFDKMHNYVNQQVATIKIRPEYVPWVLPAPAGSASMLSI